MSKNRFSMKTIKCLLRAGENQRNYLFWSDMIETGLPQGAVMLNALCSGIEEGSIELKEDTKAVIADIIYDYGNTVFTTAPRHSPFKKSHRVVEMGLLVDSVIETAIKHSHSESVTRESVYGLLPASAQQLLDNMGYQNMILKGQYRQAIGV